jgi:hypothetical protein
MGFLEFLVNSGGGRMKFYAGRERQKVHLSYEK